MKILSYGDYAEFTGFGRVMQGIMQNLPQFWEIVQVGISYNPQNELGNIPDNMRVVDAYSKSGDYFGRKKLLRILGHSDFDCDVVFLLQDSFILTQEINLGNESIPFIEAVRKLADKRDAKVVTYTPVDQPRPYAKDWFDPLIKNSDELVYYLDWARRNVNRYAEEDHLEASVIHHGVDRDNFFPLDSIQKMEIQNQLGLPDDKFKILWGGANQRRKNVPHDVLGAFTELYKQRQDVKLLMKTNPNKGVGNKGEGWNLGKILNQFKREFDLPEGAIQFIGSDQGMLPKSKLNQIYNSVDCVYNPSCEGWGMWTTEAMSTRTSTIVGDHAALSEIGDKGRSIKVKTSDTLQDRVYFTDDWEVYRSQIVLDSFVDNMINLMEMSDGEVNEMLDRGEDSDYTRPWESIANEWRELFERVANE